VADSSFDRLRLRAGYDEQARAFDRTRPVCPPELFDDVIHLAQLAPGSTVLEIGCGSGQATVPLAQRGLAVTAVELGSELAALARATLARFEAVEVITTSFEAWEPAGALFDAVIAFNSLHWVDPEVRYAKPARLLKPGGALIVAGCSWATPDDAQSFWSDVQEDYRAVAAPGGRPPPPETIGPNELPSDARILFDQVEAHRYPFSVEYSARDYLAHLRTQAVTRQLREDARHELLSRIQARLVALGWPDLTASFVGLLTVARLA
jgi:protein-L-isoaspartate O-methyltransferase